MGRHSTSSSSADSEEDSVRRLDYGEESSGEERSIGSQDDERNDGGGSSSEDDSEGEFDKNKGAKDFSIRSIKSIVTTRRLKQLHQEYSIDPCIGLRIPESRDDPCDPPQGEVVFHTPFFSSELRLLLHPVFSEILQR